MVDDGAILYRFAVDCAEHKVMNSCNKQCHSCASNISAYTDKRTAVLLQHRAELEVCDRLNTRATHLRRTAKAADDRQKGNRAINVLALIVGLILPVSFIIGIIVTCEPRKPVVINTPSQVTPAPQPVTPYIPPTPQVQTHDYLEDIRTTLRKIYRVDMDGNGRITCIDYAVQFWNYYPRQNEVRVIWNNNRSRNWNHLFVKVNGMMIEPAAYLSTTNPERWFTIQRIWPNKYDSSLDVDVTQHMDRIKVGRYWID